jgi:type II secretory pathway predicted ATPase ExeA
MENPNRFRLYGLKRLIAVVREAGGTLSVVPAGHPKPKNDVRRPSIEEIGSRATIFELEGLGREKRKFFAASLAEVPQGVELAALHHRSQLLESLVR